MKFIKKSLLYLFILIGVFVFIIYGGINTVFAKEEVELTVAEEFDLKLLSYYRETIIEENFEDDKINIILTKEFSRMYGEINLELFSILGEDIKSIQDTFPGEYVEGFDRETFRQMLTIELNIKSKENILLNIRKLQSLDEVLIAEPSYIYEFQTFFAPNDEFYPLQWGLHGTYGINAPMAWDISKGNANIRVGVMEGGQIDSSHLDLIGRVNNSLAPGYVSEHKTHVAGIIGAIQNNREGISGVANVTLYSLDWDGPSFANTINTARNNNIKIINMSFGYTSGTYSTYNSTHYNAIYGYRLYGLIVCAAGNSNRNNDLFPVFPASYDSPNLITVGSMNEDGNKRGASNYGQMSVHLFAPGGNVLSTFPATVCQNHNIVFLDDTRLCEFDELDRNYLILWASVYGWQYVIDNFLYLFEIEPAEAKLMEHIEDGYHEMSGTSMAAPHVSGVAALMLTIYPNFSGTDMKKGILNCVDKESNLTTLCVTGGRLNAYKAVRFAERMAAPQLSGNSSFNPYNLLSDYQSGIREYRLALSNQFVSFKLDILRTAGFTYQQGNITIMDMYGNVIKKYDMNGTTKDAKNDYQVDNLTVWLGSDTLYCIVFDLVYSPSSLTRFTVDIVPTINKQLVLDVFDDVSLNNLYHNLITNSGTGDNIKQINIKQNGKFQISYNASSSFIISPVYLIAKQDGAGVNATLSVISYGNFYNSFSAILNLEAGIYFIGYFDSIYLNSSTITVSIERLITQSGASILIPDMSSMLPLGSEVTLNGGTYGGNTITQGFTRNIFLDPYTAPDTSRLQYTWYSSNPTYASVSEFGTVYAGSSYMAVDLTIYICAVYKADPSKVFIKDFIIRKETSLTPININLITMNITVNNYYSVNFGNTAVPYGFLQNYMWYSSSSSLYIDGWGRMYAYSNAIGTTVNITGVYWINQRVTIHLVVNVY